MDRDVHDGRPTLDSNRLPAQFGPRSLFALSWLGFWFFLFFLNFPLAAQVAGEACVTQNATLHYCDPRSERTGPLLRGTSSCFC